MKNTTIQQALEYVAAHPQLSTDELTQVPVHTLVAHTVYEIANNVDQKQRGSLARANKARRMIFDRLVGKRRTGSAPLTRTETPITFVDLTGRQVEAPPAKDDTDE